MVCLRTHLLTYILFQSVIRQSITSSLVQIVLKEDLIFGSDSMIVQCVPHGLRDLDSIYHIILSKIVNGIPTDIVGIESDTSNPPSYLKVVWYDNDMKSRALVNESTLLPIADAKLKLFVNSTMVSCNDNGIYRCSISTSGGMNGYSSGSIAIEVLKQSVQVTDETADKKDFYNAGDTVILKCSAAFSLPSCIKWCISRENDATPSEYDIIHDIVNSDLANDGCQYRRHSVLSYNVTKEDTNTVFICEISDKEVCSATTTQGQIAIQNSNVYRVTVELTENILYRQQSIIIKCQSKQLDMYERIDKIALSKIRFGHVSPLIEARFNTWKTFTTWYDNDFMNRSKLIHSYIVPDRNGTLQLEIPADKVECRDAVIYRCEMFLHEDKYSFDQKAVKLIANGQFVEAKVTPLIEMKKDALDLQCITSYFDKEDTVNQIILSKATQNTTTKVFGVELRYKSEVFTTRLQWYSDDFKIKSEVIKATVYPASKSGLHIRLKAENVGCIHAGKYTCTLTASNAKHGTSEARVDIAVKSANSFSVTEKTCPQSKGYFNVGHKTVLKCGGDVGNPPRELVWCRRLFTETIFTPFLDKSKMSFTNLIPQDCIFVKYSIIEYNVTDIDEKTDFGCASTDDECSLIDEKNIYTIKKYTGHNEGISQVCYKENIQYKDEGPPTGYIAAVSILSILLAVSVIVFCYLFFRRR